jgi:tetratricopeptide (TPR) repeat protein
VPGKILSIGVALIAAVVMAADFLSAVEARARQENQLDKGIIQLTEGHFAEALAAFNQFKQTAVSDARAYFYSGMALVEMGRLNAAALELDEAVRLDPRQPQYLIFQANVFSRLKQNEHALEALATLGSELTQPRFETAWLWLASDTYYRLERFDEVLKVLDLLSRRAPDDARVDFLRGQAYVVKGDFDRALEAFKKSLQKSPEYAPAQFELGKIYYQRNELEASQKALREAIRLDPHQPEYFLKLGQVCLALGQTEKAIEHLTKVEHSDPELAQTYYALGGAYQRKGNPAKAAEYRRKFQEISTEQRRKQELEEEVSRLIALGEKQLDQGNEAAARDLFEQAVKLAPNNWDAHGYLAEMMLSTTDWRRAYPHLVKMEESDPDSPVGNYLMAKYWHRSKEFGKALTYAEKVRLARPGHAELRNLIGSIYAALGQAEKAVPEFEAAVRLAPDRADFLENLRKVKDRKPQ